MKEKEHSKNMDDRLHQISKEFYEQREYYIDLFCKTFFVSQEPRSAEELRYLFQCSELEIRLGDNPMGWNIRVKLKDEKGEYQNMEWISVKDEMPNVDQRVLVYQKDGVHGGHPIDIEYLLCDGFWKDQGLYSGITHWMPLPKPPGE